MFLLYNGQLLPEEELRLPLTNRAFQYNDGFFETIILDNNRLRFWEHHQARMQEAAAVLQLALPQELVGEAFEQKVKQLADLNNCATLARIKLKVWRGGEGLYTPQTEAAVWLLTANSTQAPLSSPLQVGISQTIRTIPSAFSSFKGINSPVYVMASKEKAERNLDDLIILDPNGNLAELTYSNLFWVKEQTLYTPSLETGCLHGIMRRALFSWATQQKWETREGKFTPGELQEAEMVFAGNVTGLRPIEQVEGRALSTQPALFQHLNATLGF